MHVLRALFSDDATREPGVTRPDRFYPLDGATNLPGPLTPGGPPMWLGGNKRRGIALAASVAQGWYMPAVVPHEGARPSDLDYFSDRRDAVLQALDEIGRDPAGFAFVAQMPTGRTPADRRSRSISRGTPSAAVRRTWCSACHRRSAQKVSTRSPGRSPSPSAGRSHELQRAVGRRATMRN